ncbi:hypothetical protein K2173_001425 [Erythroxylum novogranatense]|uniref:BED-type domain-containing protein n=1 Tax=Erythroxylum novogranatense TaxID=1862640 RepID=A0AAV8S6Y3_9ROSI|nr:hypothetical protein K2173_001425 [Erythroxylum novogranatense]
MPSAFVSGASQCGGSQKIKSCNNGSRKDVCWEYAEKLDGNKVKCRFCQRVLNGGISRLKHHLSRLPSKGVNPCSKVRDDVTDRAPSPVAKVYPTVAPMAISSLSNQENAERSIALFFFENKLDLSVARSPSYQLMIDAITKCSAGFTGPSAEMLKTAWLERMKSEVSLQLKDIEKEWATTGCTIIADTWTDNKSRALINFLVSSPSRTFFHKSVDASSYFKNTKYLAELFDSVIQDFGPENVVQIIMDSSFNYTGIANHILQNYGTIFVSPCASQCLNLVLEEFSKVDWVNRCILQAQTISKFIYNSTSMLDLMKKFTGGQDIIRTGLTRSVSNFLSLQSMLKQRSRLKLMFSSPEFSTNSSYANKPQSIACVAIVEDGDFWRQQKNVLRGKPAVGSIYELMTRAKESIRTYYIMDESKCKTFLDIVDRVWRDQLHSSLHSAAAFLNPSVQYNPEIKFVVSIKEDFSRRDITNQIFIFTRASGMFGCNLAMEAGIQLHLVCLWWEQFGDPAPVLQRVAIRILSQVCSSFTFERHWNTFQQIHSEKRNKIDKETLNDLIYVNYNLKLARQMRTKPENDNPSPTQWLDRFGPALDGGDLNTRQFSSIFGANDPLFGL